MIAVDSSAVFAILFSEPDAVRYAEAIADNDDLVMAAPTLVECHFVVYGRFLEKGREILDDFISSTGIDVVSFDRTLTEAAIDARVRYGRGSSHRAQLNFGDCFSYALARTRNVPLLYKGDDFVHTDIEAAI